MTKKDYERIAKALAAAKPHPYGQPGDFHDGRQGQHEQVVTILAEELALDNPRFDRSRFYAACGI